MNDKLEIIKAMLIKQYLDLERYSFFPKRHVFKVENIQNEKIRLQTKLKLYIVLIFTLIMIFLGYFIYWEILNDTSNLFTRSFPIVPPFVVIFFLILRQKEIINGKINILNILSEVIN